MTALRKKIYSMIEKMPEKSLKALEPLLTHLVDIDDDNWVIEPASPEETAMIKERMKDYKKDPSSFVPLSSIK